MNTNLFQTYRGPAPDAVNAHGKPAFAMSPRHELAQMAATGTFADSFYESAENQLQRLLQLLDEVGKEPDSAAFIAKLAIYAREKGLMKDMPAFLTAALFKAKCAHAEAAFARVIDNPRMLRTFCQIIRSGQLGMGKNFGRRAKRAVQRWLRAAPAKQLIAHTGQKPSLGDIIKMVRPRPHTKYREGLFRYLIGKDIGESILPHELIELLQFRHGTPDDRPVPRLPFMLLADQLTEREWVEVAKQMPWRTVLKNLNTLQRHGVFDYDGGRITQHICMTLDLQIPDNAMVYEVFNAYKHAKWEGMAPMVVATLNSVAEKLAKRAPMPEGQTIVCPDVSYSMTMPVTGNRGSATSKVQAVDVAGIIAATYFRGLSNCQVSVIPFDTYPRVIRLNPADSILTTIEKLSIKGSGTDCACALELINEQGLRPDNIIYVSDNESWAGGYYGRSVPVAQSEAWRRHKKYNPKARLVCLDTSPNKTTQTKTGPDVLHLGGFSDQIFKTIADFTAGRHGPNYWLEEIEAVEL